MFGFTSMSGNYNSRCVDYFEGDGFAISTARVTDSTHPFETAVGHPEYNNGKWVIVELYDSHESAKSGHAQWVSKMTNGKLPESLIDVSGADIALLADAVSTKSEIESWRTKVRQPKST